MNQSNAQSWNLELDEHLNATGEVGKDLFAEFKDAESYGAASSVHWLEAKLRVLRNRLERGEPLHLYTPPLETGVICTSTDALRRWVNEFFPTATVE